MLASAHNPTCVAPLPGSRKPRIGSAKRITKPSLEEHVALSELKAHHFGLSLQRATLCQHFSKASKTNLLKTYEQVSTMAQCPHYELACYLVLMVSANEKRLMAVKENEASAAFKLSGNPWVRAQVNPDLITKCLTLSAAEHESTPGFNFLWGRYYELCDQPAQARWYYRLAAHYAAEQDDDNAPNEVEARLCTELKPSLERITKNFSRPATINVTARRQELLAKVQDLTRRFKRYPEGVAVPLVAAHQQLVQDILSWYLPSCQLTAAPFPDKNWGLRGALDPSIKGTRPTGFWLNPKGSIELVAAQATKLERIQIEELSRLALYQQHALFTVEFVAETEGEGSASELNLAQFSAWLKDCYPRLSATRLDGFSHSKWSQSCALIALIESLPIAILLAYAQSLGLNHEQSCSLFSGPYRELASAASLGLQLSCVRLNAHDFALPDGAPRKSTAMQRGNYGRIKVQRLMASLSEQLSRGGSCAELLGYSLGVDEHYLDLMVYDSAMCAAILKKLKLSATPLILSAQPAFFTQEVAPDKKEAESLSQINKQTLVPTVSAPKRLSLRKNKASGFSTNTKA